MFLKLRYSRFLILCIVMGLFRRFGEMCCLKYALCITKLLELQNILYSQRNKYWNFWLSNSNYVFSNCWHFQIAHTKNMGSNTQIIHDWRTYFLWCVLFLNFSSERSYSCLMAQQRSVQTVNSQFVKEFFFCAGIPVQCEWQWNNHTHNAACQLERFVWCTAKTFCFRSFFFFPEVLMYKPKHKALVYFFQIPSQNCEKRLLASCLSVRLSVRMEQLRSHWTDFHEIWNSNVSRTSVEEIQVWLRSDKNKKHFTRRQMYMYYSTALNYS